MILVLYGDREDLWGLDEGLVVNFVLQHVSVESAERREVAVY